MIDKQYKVVVKPNNKMTDLLCNGGWLKPEQDGNYIFYYCEKENDNYVAVGFCPIFIPKEFIIDVKENSDGDFLLG